MWGHVGRGVGRLRGVIVSAGLAREYVSAGKGETLEGEGSVEGCRAGCGVIGASQRVGGARRRSGARAGQSGCWWCGRKCERSVGPGALTQVAHHSDKSLMVSECGELDDSLTTGTKGDGAQSVACCIRL